MGPPVGSRPPDSSTPERVRADTTSKAVRKSGGEQEGTVSQSGSKRSAQHAEYHTAEHKRRRGCAERAAQAQKHATQLVQQLAAPDGNSMPQESSGIMAKAEDRQKAYNLSMDSKPWASSHDSLHHNMDPAAGLPMQTGHHSDADPSGGQHPAATDAATDDSPVEQTNSDPAIWAAALHSDSSEDDSDAGNQDIKAGSPPPPASECAKFSSTQKIKRNVHSNPGLTAIKDRQMDEQTHQNHPQNLCDSSNRQVQPVSLGNIVAAGLSAHSHIQFILHMGMYDTSLLRH